MRTMKIIATICLVAMTLPAKSLLLLPIAEDLLKPDEKVITNQFYREAIENQYQGAVSAPSDTTVSCGERNCALKAAEDAKADEVVYSTLRRFGSSWIFTSTVIGGAGAQSFSQHLSISSVNEMEPVVKRMAVSLLKRKPLEETVAPERTTENEETDKLKHQIEPNSGEALALGVTIPLGKSFNYVDSTRAGYQLRTSPIIPRFMWQNYWGFGAINLDVDFVMGMPRNSEKTLIGSDFNLVYFLNRGSNISPFLGAGLGMYGIPSDANDSLHTKWNGGPALNLQGGVSLFRAYKMQVAVRGQYQVIFSSDKEQAFNVDMAISFPERRNSEGKKSSWASFWKYWLLVPLVIGSVGAAAGN